MTQFLVCFQKKKISFTILNEILIMYRWNVLIVLLLVLLEARSSQGQSKYGKKRGKKAKCAMVQEMELKINSMKSQLETLSNPIHVHLDGAKVVPDMCWGRGESEEGEDMTSYQVDSWEQDLSIEDSREFDSKDSRDKYSRENKSSKSHSKEKTKSKLRSLPDSWFSEERRGKKYKKKHHKHHSHERHLSRRKGEPDMSFEDKEAGSPSPGGTHLHLHLNVGVVGSRDKQPTSPLTEYPEQYFHARCDMASNSAISSLHNIKGTIFLRQWPGKELEVRIDIRGFNHGQVSRMFASFHGLHVHQFGDTSNGCNSMGGHFNPTEVRHGGPAFQNRHAGDWGNIRSDHRGLSKTNFTDAVSTLLGRNSIVGRGIVLHEKKDDLGQGESEASLASGDAGARLACCIISWCPGW